MGFDTMVMLMCGALWVIHGVRLARAPFARAWPAFVIVVVGVGVTAGAYLLARPFAAHAALAAVAGLLVIPALAVRAASRALRFGRIGRARALARIAAVLRPLPIQRRFLRAVEITWRLWRGETIDVEAAITALGAVSPVERDVHRVAFLSWTNDFVTMAELLAEPKVKSFALRGGMVAIVTSVTGETGTVEDLVALYRRLAKTKALSRRTLDSAGTLTAMAAYLGDEDTVRKFSVEMERDVPHERIAFLVATAAQRAGRHEVARQTLDEALVRPDISASGRARLVHRRDHPIASLSDDERALARSTVDQVRERLDARRALGALGFGLSRRAPLSWAMTAVLGLVFIWETTEARRLVFAAWGLISPFDDAPDAYRLLTYAMLHVDGGHFLVNALGLIIFGRFVEHHFGAWRWALVYVLGALGGGAAFLLLSTRLGVAIGASGAVLALFGATVARIALDGPLRRSAQGKRELTFLVVIAASQLVGDLFIAQSSGSAHAGGFVTGFLLGALLRRRD